MVVWYTLEEDSHPIPVAQGPQGGVGETYHLEGHWSMDYLRKTKGRQGCPSFRGPSG